MIRVVSTFCVGLMGFTILSAYDVSEQTRIATQELSRSEKQIKSERSELSVLEAQWQKAASPETIQKLAEDTLGMQNATSVQLASVSQLPRRGSDALNGEEVRSASAPGSSAPGAVAAPETAPIVKIAARSGM